MTGFDGLLVDRGQEQRHRAHRIGRGLRKQIQVVSDDAAQGIDLVRLGRQFDRLVAFAKRVFGKEAHRTFTGVERCAEQLIVEGTQVSEFDSRSAGVVDRLTDADVLFQLILTQRCPFQPARRLVVIDHHGQVQGLDGLVRGIGIEAPDRQVEVLSGDRDGGKIQHADFECFDRPVEVHLRIMSSLLFLKVALFFIELFFQGLAPALLLLHLGQLLLIEGNLYRGFVD
ncbi:hypothetical protein D3C78_953130 [compost metagenome]